MKRPEQNLQIACVRWFRYQYPDLVLFHIPNGGRRGKAEAGIFKAMGVTAGVPDLLLCVARNFQNGLFIEMKSDKGKPTESQKSMHKKLLVALYEVKVCNSFEQFQQIINEYLNQ